MCIDMKEFSSSSEKDTARLGTAIGNALTPGFVLGLNGTLGSGKTRLAQAIGASLGIPTGDVVSPTFTICVPHEGRVPFLHLDAYRIVQLTEIDELGLDESVEDGVALIIEWAMRVEKYLPPIDVSISIESTGTDSRHFHFEANSQRGKQLLTAVSSALQQDG